VVHVNPGSEKERGHMGSQGQRKAESALFVRKDKDISTIEPKLLRNAGIGDTPQIQFTYDKTKGYHVSCGTKADAMRSSKDLKRIEEAGKIANIVFSGQNSFKYSEAQDEIMKASKKGVTAAKSMFTDMKVHEIIFQSEDGRWRLK
jgi:hypothetical protein